MTYIFTDATIVSFILDGGNRHEIVSGNIDEIDYYGGYLYFTTKTTFGVEGGKRTLERMKPDGTERILLYQYYRGSGYDSLKSLSVGLNGVFWIQNEVIVNWMTIAGPPIFTIPTFDPYSSFSPNLALVDNWTSNSTKHTAPVS